MSVRNNGIGAFSADDFSSVTDLVAALPTDPTLSGVWGQRLAELDEALVTGVAPTNRGLILEEYDFLRRGGRMPPELNTYNHRFYPIADDFTDGTLTQYKTVDFANFFQTSERIGAWETGTRADIQRLIDTIDPETGGIAARTVDGVAIGAIRPQDIEALRFEIVVPPRFSANSDVAGLQRQALQRVVEFADGNGVEVVLRWAN